MRMVPTNPRRPGIDAAGMTRTRLAAGQSRRPVSDSARGPGTDGVTATAVASNPPHLT